MQPGVETFSEYQKMLNPENLDFYSIFNVGDRK